MSTVIKQFEWVSSAKFCLIGTFDSLFEEMLAKGEKRYFLQCTSTEGVVGKQFENYDMHACDLSL